MKSLFTYILLSLSLIIFSFSYYPRYEKGGSEATISWDVSGYYWYLPAAFIYHDLKNLSFSDSIRNAYSCSPDNQQITFLSNNRKVLKYSSGMAVQYLPFFFAAHLLAKPLGYLPDGFSPPYQLAIQIGALLSMLLGLWVLRKLLLRYYKDGTVAVVLLLLAWGTNYTNYVCIDPGMSHAWLFTLYAMLMLSTDNFYRKPAYGSAIQIGFLIGLLILSRPSEMIAGVLFLFWGLSSLSRPTLRERAVWLWQQRGYLSWALVCLLLTGGLQIAYWKYVSGDWLVYSYGDQKFSWLKPHFIDYLFSYRVGWLLYCPMMLLAYAGFVTLFKQRIQFWPVLLFSLLNLWVVTAWDIWWYGGRAMLQGSSVLMFPLAALVESVHQKSINKLLFYPVAALFLYLNIWWLHGTHKGCVINASDMTPKYYWKSVGRMSVNPQDRKFLFVSEEYTGKDSGTLVFQTNANPIYIDTQHTDTLTQTFSAASLHGKWLRFGAHVVCKSNNWDPHQMTDMGLQFTAGNQVIKRVAIQLDQLFYTQKTLDVFIDSQIPNEAFDSVSIFVQHSAAANGTFELSHLYLKSLR
jgi:hypothetical protein